MGCSEVRIRVQGTGVRVRTSQGLPGPPGPPGGASDSIITAQTDETLLPGQVVYTNAGAHFNLAIAIARPQTKSVGLSLFPTGAGNLATVQTQDIVTLPTADWDAVTGQLGGLTPGAVYYLSDTTPGRITTVPVVADPPNVKFNSRIGTALSATALNVRIRSPIKL